VGQRVAEAGGERLAENMACQPQSDDGASHTACTLVCLGKAHFHLPPSQPVQSQLPPAPSLQVALMPVSMELQGLEAGVRSASLLPALTRLRLGASHGNAVCAERKGGPGDAGPGPGSSAAVSGAWQLVECRMSRVPQQLAAFLAGLRAVNGGPSRTALGCEVGDLVLEGFFFFWNARSAKRYTMSAIFRVRRAIHAPLLTSDARPQILEHGLTDIHTFCTAHPMIQAENSIHCH
jgi:hypothetical protein